MRQSDHGPRVYRELSRQIDPGLQRGETAYAAGDLESLFDVDRSIKQAVAQKDALEKDMKEEEAALKAKELQTNGMQGPADLPKEHKDLFRLLKTHMSNSITWSAYNWINPKLWSLCSANNRSWA